MQTHAPTPDRNAGSCDQEALAVVADDNDNSVVDHDVHEYAYDGHAEYDGHDGGQSCSDGSNDDSGYDDGYDDGNYYGPLSSVAASDSDDERTGLIIDTASTDDQDEEATAEGDNVIDANADLPNDTVNADDDALFGHPCTTMGGIGAWGASGQEALQEGEVASHGDGWSYAVDEEVPAYIGDLLPVYHDDGPSMAADAWDIAVAGTQTLVGCDAADTYDPAFDAFYAGILTDAVSGEAVPEYDFIDDQGVLAAPSHDETQQHQHTIIDDTQDVIAPVVCTLPDNDVSRMRVDVDDVTGFLIADDASLPQDAMTHSVSDAGACSESIMPDNHIIAEIENVGILDTTRDVATAASNDTHARAPDSDLVDGGGVHVESDSIAAVLGDNTDDADQSAIAAFDTIEAPSETAQCVAAPLMDVIEQHDADAQVLSTFEPIEPVKPVADVARSEIVPLAAEATDAPAATVDQHAEATPGVAEPTPADAPQSSWWSPWSWWSGKTAPVGTASAASDARLKAPGLVLTKADLDSVKLRPVSERGPRPSAANAPDGVLGQLLGLFGGIAATSASTGNSTDGVDDTRPPSVRALVAAMEATSSHSSP